MGYSRLSMNEEEILEGMLKGTGSISDINFKDYPEQRKQLLRKKLILKNKNMYIITNRGISAVKQQIQTGSYWLSPLGTQKRLNSMKSLR